MTPLLKVQDLHVAYKLRTGETFPALAGLSFELEPGEILGVLGESGSGKSTLAASLLRLLPPNGIITRGVILFEGQNILEASPRELEKMRGSRMALIFQEPSMALHPAMRVGDQVAEVLRAHESMDRAARRVRVLSAEGRGPRRGGSADGWWFEVSRGGGEPTPSMSGGG